MQDKGKFICTLPSPAKINRFLRIVKQLDNGMHQIQTLFQFIDLADSISFYQTDQPSITTNLPSIDNSPNIVLKAAELLLDIYKKSSNKFINNSTNQAQNPNGAYGTYGDYDSFIADKAQNPNGDYGDYDSFIADKAQNPNGAYGDYGDYDSFIADNKLGIHIEITKRIPTGAGLGGGSSNAATCLLALNKIWQMNLTPQTLAQIGLELGADVPIFIYGKTALAQGVGEQITPVDFVDTPKILLIYPGQGNCTKSVFQHKDLARNNPPLELDLNATSRRIPTINDAKLVARKINPSLEKAWQWLENYGEVQLTGSGSCIFSLQEDSHRANNILEKMPSDFAGFRPKAYLVQTLNESLLKKALARFF